MHIMSSLRSAVGAAVLLALPGLVHAGPLAERQGRWLGDMAIPNGPTLKIGADLFTRLDGTAWASLASPTRASTTFRRRPSPRPAPRSNSTCARPRSG